MDGLRMSKKPNIVFLMTDQQRLDSLGAYGSPYGATPNLDLLASDSVVFDSYYAACPLCVPTRSVPIGASSWGCWQVLPGSLC